LWNSATATPPLHSTRIFNKLNNYVKELYYLLPNGTNIGGFRGKTAPGEFLHSLFSAGSKKLINSNSA